MLDPHLAQPKTDSIHGGKPPETPRMQTAPQESQDAVDNHILSILRKCVEQGDVFGMHYHWPKIKGSNLKRTDPALYNTIKEGTKEVAKALIRTK